MFILQTKNKNYAYIESTSLLRCYGAISSTKLSFWKRRYSKSMAKILHKLNLTLKIREELHLCNYFYF